jgi:type II secretory ATPase GspE/PulE/Tfp pilus assembly ATPase PilB-like protein
MINNGILDALYAEKIINQELVEFVNNKNPNNSIAVYELLQQNDISINIISNALAKYYNLATISIDELPWNQINNDLQYKIYKNSVAYFDEQKHIWKILICTPQAICEAEYLIRHLNNTAEIYFIDLNNWCMFINKIQHCEIIKKFQHNLAIDIILYQQHINDYAITNNASDIHYEPMSCNAIIRMRIDGSLQKIMSHSLDNHNKLIARLKLMSELDISECRKPQDARLITQSRYGHQRDSRLSIIPTINNEKAVLRILNTDLSVPEITMLGMHQQQFSHLHKSLQQQSGLILVTGPTGSGKSTTLYSILKYLKLLPVNITTVEDPVELAIDGITQTPVRHNIDLDFKTILRSVLRQDPDVIMIGEIRDLETAEIAIQAANTGHLVLSTLHTNDTISSINRLLHMGIACHLLDCIKLIISQRLLPKICKYCNAKNKECLRCNGGFKGREAVFEVLNPIETSITTILSNTAEQSRKIAIAAGMISMEQHILQKQQQNIIA